MTTSRPHSPGTDQAGDAPEASPAIPTLAVGADRPAWVEALSRLSRSRYLRWLHTLPILYKVLFANAAIVIGGAIVGTFVTYHTSRGHDPISLPMLISGFVLFGFPLSILVNYVVLLAAFRPIETLQRTATAVRMGDMAARTRADPFTDPQIRHLSDTFDAILDELARDRREIEALASQVIDAQEQERRRLARELHDDTAQLLFAQLLRISTIRASADGPVLDLTEDLEQMTVQALESVRRLALELRPPALDDLGLFDALAELCQRFSDQLGIPVRFEHRGSRARIGQEVELVVYRVAQEALTNVAKHADARHVWVTMDRSDREITISVRDDGVGIQSTIAGKSDDKGLGLGLFGMEERVALAGGSFRVWSRGIRGTEVFALIPLLGATPLSSRPADLVWPRNPRRSIFSVLPPDENAPAPMPEAPGPTTRPL